MHTLVMPLVGPMQSWGHRSRFDDRDTGLEPTRSGVIGLICAAMGIPRSGDLSRFDNLRMGVRVDAPGRVMVDYHTAMDVVKADGGGTGTVTSHRYYLSDARFLVGLESDQLELLQSIENALKHPVWAPFLGRKSFVPSIPVFRPEGSVQANTGLQQALTAHPFLRLHAWEKIPEEPLRMVIESEEPQSSDLTRNDVPISYRTRRFALRQVRTDWVPPEQLIDGGVWLCTSPNS